MEYFAPQNLGEAEKLKNKIRGSIYLAGGTILNWRNAPQASALIDLKSLSLDGVKDTDQTIEIGAMTTIQDVVDKNVDFLAQIAENSIVWNIRNIATIGGNVAGKFFISHIQPTLLALKADITYFLEGEKKTDPLEKWFEKKTGIVCSFSIKKSFRKLVFRETLIAESDFPVLFTVFGYESNHDRLQRTTLGIKNPNLSISGLRGKTFYTENLNFKKMNESVQKQINPISDIKTSKKVKRRIVEDHIISIMKELK